MQAEWIRFNNHLALRYSGEIMHPNASEVYAALTSQVGNFTQNIQCLSLEEAFPEIRFSSIGTKLRCHLDNGDHNEIMLHLYCIRHGKEIIVDMVEGEIIDQCITDSEWFYVTGSASELSATFRSCGIKQPGKITVTQYIEIIRSEKSYESGTIDNCVQTSLLNKTISTCGELPIGLKATLYDYQKIGFYWMKYMLRDNKGCILGDEMGLGKTLQVIALMLDFKANRRIPMLVIAPVSLLNNWVRECEKFAPSLTTCIHHGVRRTGRYKSLEKYDVIITSYSMAITDASLFRMIDWKLLVIDEAQNIKNPASARAKFVKIIPRESCVAITGTPFENHMTDIWSIVDFVMPGLLGSQKEYEENVSDDVEGADRIQPILTPIMIRRMVNDVAKDLPERIIIPQPINMSDAEALKYEGYRLSGREGRQAKQLDLGVLQKLRMFCTLPSLCEQNIPENPSKESIKYQRLCEIVEEIVASGEKIILFTSFKKMATIIENDFSIRFGMPVWKINGDTPVDERQEIVDVFNDVKGSALLVLNPRAAGTGLNITSANHVIHYNLEWNPALEDQASARAYRRGQTKTVFVYRLFYKDTVEQIINERIERKREMAETAIVGTDGKTENRDDIIAALNISPVKEY